VHIASRFGVAAVAAVATLVADPAVSPSAVNAGVLCGTVRDRTTNGPIARAGVFVRAAATGAYTGLSAGTDAQGRFCVDPIPAGTYDLEIRVDDYRVGYRTGVVVTDDPTDVDLEAALASFDLWPQPARGEIFIALRLARAAPIRLEVFDARGRLVKAWAAPASVGERTFRWDFRDRGGRLLPAATYWVRLRAADVVAVRSVTRVP
jgi:hypothetical protein